MSKGQLVESASAKAAGGRPYSPAMRVGDYLYISGQVPLDGSGNTVGPSIRRLRPDNASKTSRIWSKRPEEHSTTSSG